MSTPALHAQEPFHQPGESPPKFIARYSPVFATRPAQLDSVARLHVVVAPDGQLTLLDGDSPWFNAWRSVIGNWKVQPGEVGAKPAWTETDLPLDYIFYAEDLPAGARPPASAFTLRDALLVEISGLCRVGGRDGHPPSPKVTWTFQVGEDGHVGTVSSGTPEGRMALKAGVERLLKGLVFRPATVDGKPVACTVTLEHDMHLGGAAAKGEPPAVTQSTPPPVLSAPFAGAEPLKATLWLQPDPTGSMFQIRMSGALPEGPALDILRTVGSWKVSLPKQDRLSSISYSTCLQLTPGKADVAQECPLKEQVFAFAVPLKLVPPEYPPDRLRSNVPGSVTCLVSIDESGKVTNVKVLAATAKPFEAPAVKSLKEARFEPALLDGKPVNSDLVLPLAFKVKKHK